MIVWIAHVKVGHRQTPHSKALMQMHQGFIHSSIQIQHYKRRPVISTGRLLILLINSNHGMVAFMISKVYQSMSKYLIFLQIMLLLGLVGCNQGGGWVGKQRLQLKNEVLNDANISQINASCMMIESIENKVSPNLISMMVKLENRCGPHVFLWRKTRLLDEQKQQVLMPKDIYEQSKYKPLLDDVRALYEQDALQRVGTTARGGLQNDADRLTWLDEHVPKSVDGTLFIRLATESEQVSASQEKWYFEFCSGEFAVDNHYFSCVNLLAAEYLSQKYF